MAKLARQATWQVTVALLAMFVGSCTTGPGSIDFERRLATEAEALLQDYGLPGMTVAVAGPGGVSTSAVGLADRENSRPMSTETTMLAASIGKTFVAATLLQLVEEGQLDLDDPISRWLGNRDWFARLPNAGFITIRHLLQHRSGLPDHVYLEAFTGLWPGRTDNVTPEELIALTFDTEPLFPAGDGWAYSDTGYLLLGLIIESVTGRLYEDVLSERFIAPLALSSTGPSNRKALPGLARAYVAVGSGHGLPLHSTDDNGHLVWNPGIEWTGGGIYATAHDLARWGQSFLSGRLLSVYTYGEAIKGVPAPGNDAVAFYGLGIAIRAESDFGPVYGHRGWIPGYVSSLQYYPEYDTTIAFQTNTDIGFIDSDRDVIVEIEERLACIQFCGQ